MVVSDQNPEYVGNYVNPRHELQHRKAAKHKDIIHTQIV